jgi:hypothetical protein
MDQNYPIPLMLCGMMFLEVGQHKVLRLQEAIAVVAEEQDRGGSHVTGRGQDEVGVWLRMAPSSRC